MPRPTIFLSQPTLSDLFTIVFIDDYLRLDQGDIQLDRRCRPTQLRKYQGQLSA